MSSRSPHSSRARAVAAITALAIAALAIAAPALAAADYRATGSINTSTIGGPSSQIDSYDHASILETAGEIYYDSFGPNEPSYHAHAYSAATPFGLHASAYAQYIKDYHGGETSTFILSSGSFAQGTWSDLVISGPPGSGNINVTFNVHLDGGDINQTTLLTTGNVTASTTMQLVFFANDENLGGGAYSEASVSGVVQPVSRNGSLASFDGDGVITSPTFSVPVNTPFSVALQLTAFAGASAPANEQFIASANCNFADTLTFATDRPVFNLPAGYTVNSADANIANNTFAVPEPTTLALLLAATTLLTTRRRRRAA